MLSLQRKQEVKSGQGLWKYEDDELNEDDVLEIARRELGETNELKATCIRLLREKIEAKRCNYPLTDDKELIKFLRAAKFDVSKAFKRMENTHHQRQKYHHLFINYHPDACKRALDMNFHYLLPYRNADGSSIIVGLRGPWKPEELSFEEYFLADHLVLETLINAPINQICGCTLIIDCEGLSYRQLSQFSPKRLSMAIASMDNAIPIRYKAIHFVSVPVIFRLFYNLIKELFTQKLRNRIFIHAIDPSYRSLHDSISPSLLPARYGGDLGVMTNDLLKQCIDKEKNYFIKLLMSSHDCY